MREEYKAGIFVLIFRSTNNLHLTDSIGNAPAKILSAGRFSVGAGKCHSSRTGDGTKQETQDFADLFCQVTLGGRLNLRRLPMGKTVNSPLTGCCKTDDLRGANGFSREKAHE